MKPTGRISILHYLLLGLVAVSLVVGTLLLMADRAVRQTTGSLEDVVTGHIRPLAAAQRLQARIDALRGFELELHQLNDFFAVPPQIRRMSDQLKAIDPEIAHLQQTLAAERPREAQRLGEHWQIYRGAIDRQIGLAQSMEMDALMSISSTQSRGAHDAISAILSDLISRTELAANAAYIDAQQRAAEQQYIISAVLAVGLLILFAGLWSFGRSVSRRITALRDTAHDIAAGTQTNPIPVSGRDELAELGRVFNTMQQKVVEREAELRNAQQRLEQRALSAEEATLAKSQFLANMSHEIRTPMNGVLGMLDILRETRMSPEQADYLTTAHESATSLLTLLNDILDLSKIEAGKVHIEEIEYDLEQVVDDAIALHADSAFAKGLKLTTTVDATLPHHLRGDPGRLRQVLNNLLSNAVKFTDSGSIDIAIAPETSANGAPLLHFEVRDSGIGIARDDQQRIFDVFTQADGSTTRRFGGTGLGLAISSQLVHAMGGTIGIESTPGAGSTFWFTIRFLAAATSGGSTPPTGLAGVRILVIDPEAAQREYLARRLTSWGCDVTETGDQEAAITAASSGGYGLVMIADASPDQDCGVLVGRLRAAVGATPVVLLSPLGRICPAEAVDTLGVDICLNRPLRKSQLQDCLQQLLGRVGTDAASVTHHPARTRHVLVAEDNPINQKVAISMLRRLGCTTDVATNGREALTHIAEHDYDLVLMDCQMPEMDGFEATESIRRSEAGTRRLPVVAMTAHALPSDRERCMAAGMDDFLTKPISLEKLRGVVDRWSEEGTEVPPRPATRRPG